MGMKRVTLIAAILAGMLVSGALAMAQTAPPQQNARLQLVWFTLGLRELENGPNSSVRLTKAQARKILPVMEDLAAKKLLPLEAKFEVRTPAGSSGPGSDARIQRQNDGRQLLDAIARMEKALNQAQISVIDNLEFVPEDYGVWSRPMVVQGPVQSSGQGPGAGLTDKQRAAIQKKLMSGLKKQADLNNEVLALLRKKAG